MRCPDDEKFAQYAEGNLNGDEQSEFLLHLRECSDCSALYAMAYGNESTGACPDEESLSCLAEGKVSENKREILLKHMAVCKTCSAEFYLIKHERASVRKKSVKNRNVFRLIAVAAMITLIIGFAGHDVLDRFTEKSMVAIMPEVSKGDLDSGIASVPPATPTPEIAPDSVSIAQSQRSDISPPLVMAPQPELRRNEITKTKMSDNYEITRNRPSATSNTMAPQPELRRADMTTEQVEEHYPSSPYPGTVTNIPGYSISSLDTQDDSSIIQSMEQDVAGSIQEVPTIYEVIYKGHYGDESEIIRMIRSITGKNEESARLVVESSSVVLIECAAIEEAQRIKKELESIGVNIEINNKRLPD